MKNNKLVLFAILSFLVVGCNSVDSTPVDSTISIEEPVSVDVPTSIEESLSEDISTSFETSVDVISSEPSFISEEIISEDSSLIEIARHKAQAKDKLDQLVKALLDKIEDKDLKAALQKFYDDERAYIESLDDLESASKAVEKVATDLANFVISTFKPLVIEKVEEIANPLINAIAYDDLKELVETFYNQQKTELNKINDLEGLINFVKQFGNSLKEYIKNETEKLLISLKNAALQELDPYVEALINKIPHEELKTEIRTFYNQEKAKLNAVSELEDVESVIAEIKEDLVTFALTKLKTIAVNELRDLVNAGLAKIANQNLKDQLNTHMQEQLQKINNATTIEGLQSTLETVLEETANYIKSLLAGTVKDYLDRLLDVENKTGYDYIPEAMRPTYNSNLVSPSDINYDFSSFTSVSSINKAGYGEQWQMIIENINQSVKMAKVFNVAQTTISLAGNAVDIYLENSYSETVNYSFSGNGYTGVFKYENGLMEFNINILTSINVPGFGNVNPIIKMKYNIVEDIKYMYISFGDNYKVTYTLSDTYYELATTYGVTINGINGSRSSYLSINKDNNKTEGHIYEYTTYANQEEGKDLIKACADFYVENNYVSVVGNKASGIIGMDGYINELYLASQGRLIGYEVTEAVSGLAAYETLWFNLWDISGINNVKVTEKTDANPSGKSTVDVYLNNSTKLLSPTYNTKLGVKTSRKYDIELRNRYYYTYDTASNTYTSHEVKVPMMFIQEGNNYNDFVADMKKDNNLTVSVTLNSAYLNKILSDNATLIDEFIRNKDSMSSQEIIDYLTSME